MFGQSYICFSEFILCFKSKVLNYNNVEGEPDQLEYRVEQKNDDEL